MDGNGAVPILRQVFSGELILPGDPGYDQACTVFNAMT